MERAGLLLKKITNAIRQAQDRLTPPMAWRWPILVLAGLLSGLGWTVLGQLVQSQSIRLTLAALGKPSLWLTALFWGLAALAAVFLTHSLWAGNFVVGAPSLLLAFVNYYKELITSTPLTVGDFTLIGQAGNIAGLNKASLTLSRNSILAIAGAVLWLIAAWFFSRPLRVRWRWSLLGAPASALAFFLLFWVGADAVIYRPMGIGLEKNRPQAVINLVCGTPLGLWRSVLSLGRQPPVPMLVLPPDLDELLSGPGETPGPEGTPGAAKQPNIIMILSESFFDITALEGVTFARDPLPEFHALLEESVSGTFYTRSLGYGTSNIELEIMTGLNTGLLSGEDLYSCPPETFYRVPAVPALLKENGYYTSLVHTFNDSIYHRQELFQYLGFDDMFFSGDFAAIYPPAAEAPDYWTYMNSRISGSYYSDDLMSDVLIAQYEKMSVAYDGPLFLYASSMEAHQPYPASKYSPDELTVDPVSSLTGEAASLLLSYCQAVANADASLGKLADYFRNCDDPTVIVFYGDHRPGLGISTGGTVYSRLGIAPENYWSADPEIFKELYSTDYLIWANDPSLLPGEPGSTWDTSCNYFGATVLNLAGIELPAYWQLIDRLARTRVADMYFFFLDREGNLSDEIAGDDPDAQRLAAMRSIVSGVLAGGGAPE